MNKIWNSLEKLANNNIEEKEILEKITEYDINSLLNDNFKNIKNHQAIKYGKAINTGASTGYLIFNQRLAKLLLEKAKLRNTNINIIYAPIKSDITDFSIIKNSVGFLTNQKGPTTFCALQSSCEGKVTICDIDACYKTSQSITELHFTFEDESKITIKFPENFITINGETLREGDKISISGVSGGIYTDELEKEKSPIKQVYSLLTESLLELSNSDMYKSLQDTTTYKNNHSLLVNIIKSDGFKGFQKLINYCYKINKLKIYTTSHTPHTLAYSNLIASKIHCVDNDVYINLNSYPFGLGLLRDERIWSTNKEINLLRMLFLEEDVLGKRYIEVKSKYIEIFSNKLYNVLKIGTDDIAVIRFLCMPLTMLFKNNFNINDFCEYNKLNERLVDKKIKNIASEKEAYHGYRGVRVIVDREDIAELWSEAVILAARNAYQNQSLSKIQILLSMVTLPQEVIKFLKILNNVAKKHNAEHIISGISIMVETAGAYILIEEFLKINSNILNMNGLLFGGNDFTAACLNMNRSDSSETIIPSYVKAGIFKDSPFNSLNTQVVGKALVNVLNIDKSSYNKNFLIGLGGEIAGNWETINWLTENAVDKGLDYITTPPNRMIYAIISSAKTTVAMLDR
ncbi:hypothetical protein QTV20_002153 [Staphylococcus pseudintermedius]|nr:hypothetical protein [Staphylococcus pseudintermedius]